MGRARSKEIVAIRIATVLLLAALSSVAAGYVETHKNEITAPVADYTTARVAQLTALTAPTKAEKKELKLLRALAKTLAKTQLALKGDFGELSAAATTAAKLGLTGAAMKPSLDQAFLRAGLSLSERVELAGDHVVILPAGKHLTAVQKILAAVALSRSQAAVDGLTASKRAALLVKANANLTKALATAEKYVLKDLDATRLPPTRYRSGDTIEPQFGGRVFVPRDSVSPVAGASIVIPKNILPSPIVVTLSAGASFVGGRNEPAGPALAVTPDGLPVLGAVVFVPYQTAPGTSPVGLSLFAKGPPETTITPVSIGSNGLMSATAPAFSTFQAGVAAPPPGQPSGGYHVQAFVTATASDLTSAGTGGLLVEILDQTMTFRLDHTASTSSPLRSLLTRTFTAGVPHHRDEAPLSLPGSLDFQWTEQGTGRFTFTLPVDSTTQVQARGVASDDGRVIAFSAHGGAFDYFGVGVRGTATASAADLVGRWAAVETGVQFLDDGAEPFTTRRHDALRFLTVDAAGGVTFDAQGTRFETDVTYRTDQADPVHERAENVVADSGSESWFVSSSGKIVGAQGARSGWLDKSAGLFVAAFYDVATRRSSLMVAARQPSTAADPSAFLGLRRLAGRDIGATVGSPTTRSSTHEHTVTYGSLDVHSATSATLAFDATSRTVNVLSGDASGATISWTMSPTAPVALSASSTDLALSLDVSGNHVAPTDERWFAFSGDGRFVLMMTRGEPTRLERGIALGVR